MLILSIICFILALGFYISILFLFGELDTSDKPVSTKSILLILGIIAFFGVGLLFHDLGSDAMSDYTTSRGYYYVMDVQFEQGDSIFVKHFEADYPIKYEIRNNTETVVRSNWDFCYHSYYPSKVLKYEKLKGNKNENYKNETKDW
jgi:hypothetical protein